MKICYSAYPIFLCGISQVFLVSVEFLRVTVVLCKNQLSASHYMYRYTLQDELIFYK